MVCLAPSLAPRAAAESESPNYHMRLALTGTVFRSSNVNDATAAYSVFLQRIARDKGYEAHVSTEIYYDAESYQVALSRQENPLLVSVILAWDYLRMEVPPEVKPRWIVAEDPTPGRRFMILVHKDRGWSSLADLRNRSINWLEFSNSTVTHDWVNVLLAEQQLPDIENFFARVTTSTKPSAVVLPVFFGNTDACVVDEPSFRLMCELNPQVERSLTPIVTSERLADVLVLFRETDWESETFKNDIADALTHLHENPDGNQMLTLFRIRSLMPFEDRYLDTIRRLKERQTRLQAPPVR